ncbi:alpha/beta fold hydrolase [Egicoccus halophilus]|uniref:Alpha/beta hydrolase n=1 Tax=Egicoccus halophilus TaxID=1670830 RepID=A0A8J3EV80_9ACTN|nr:alpha/beta hydrolase [Egicoccus halophilus]GGI07564.1 alpha/beta hydrolase [Egicoccus halophilus]
MADDIRSQTVSMSHGTTRYFEVGFGEQAALLLHGVGYSPAATSWLPTMGLMRDSGIRLIAPDFVGWGEGDVLEQEYSFAYLVDFVREFQDALGLTRTHIVGHSMGGWIASIFAYESPNRVEKLVLIGSGGIATRKLASMVEWQPPTEEEVRADMAFLAEQDMPRQDLLDEALARASDEAHIGSYRRIKTHMSVPETRTRYQTVRRLPHVHNDALVLWGTDDDINDMSLAEKTHELLPNSTLHAHPGLGHFLPQQNPDVVADELRTFLKG